MLTESMEDYLEMIYRLIKDRGYVRAVDLTEELHIQASSVTKMIQRLDEAGFIQYKKYRNIALTAQGEQYGRFLVWRDATLKEFLRLLRAPSGINEQVEGIEHYITPVTMDLIASLVEFLRSQPAVLRAFYTHHQKHLSPESKDLAKLRAWEFRHSTEE